MPKTNDPPMNEEMEVTGFELEISLKRKLEGMADKGERSLSGLLRLIVKQFLDGKGTL